MANTDMAKKVTEAGKKLISEKISSNITVLLILGRKNEQPESTTTSDTKKGDKHPWRALVS